MDGKGYPKGIYAGDMSIPARVLAIADVFEALTAADRPYKKGKTLSESMRIMGFMKKGNHLDPELFDEFVRSKVYLQYAHKHLAEQQIDAVDEAALLAMAPDSFELPARDVRELRWRDFLPEYKRLLSL
jgi:HD-GYP domain-containing protein (c-di-GMP phosphodiesterase class II)